MAISNNNTGIRTGVCTSTTRPTAPYEGQHIYETDTDKVLVWNGSAWKQIPTAATAGTVLQTIYGSSTTQVPNAGTAYVDAGISATITPQATTNKILVIATTPIYMADSDCNVFVRVLRSATEISLSIQNDSTSANAHQSSSMVVLDSPSTTSATTYKIQWKNNNAAKTSYVMNNGQFGSIILQEIAG